MIFSSGAFIKETISSFTVLIKEKIVPDSTG
jgi:hypothetical protein